jgi:23S rRNA (cytosine1962-C5)-methyltransferase
MWVGARMRSRGKRLLTIRQTNNEEQRTKNGNIPQAVVSARAAARLRAGHLWVYRSDLYPSAPNAGAPGTPNLERVDNLVPGSLVAVMDRRGKLLGSGLYSSASQIAVRLLARKRLEASELPAILRQRILDALAYRDRVVRNTDAYRLIFSEADLLPGLIADCYHDLIAVQMLTQAMDQAPLREVVIETLAQALQPVAIIERVDAHIRELEQLPARQGQVLFAAGPTAGSKTSTIFTMNGVRFHYDPLAGQKTGAFLDQRENYAAAEQHAHGRALDVFTYQGGFALHLNRVCEQVTAVDSSLPALQTAEQNAALNGGREIEWIEGNAFDLLRDYADAGQQYDTIVLDPPAFAKSRRALDTAMRGYKELNLRALKMLARGAVLVTCSCSFHVSEAEFLDMLAQAAADAHRELRILERRGQAPDHPVLLAVPETSYLKCVICQVL